MRRAHLLLLGALAATGSLTGAHGAAAAGWTVQPAAIPTGAADAGLSSVACTRGAPCVAVGSEHNALGLVVPSALSLKHGRWAAQSIPAPAGASVASLSAVACTGPAACTAVGSLVDRAGRTRALAERWDGARWRIERVPAPRGARMSELQAVSCPSRRFCVAVGDFLSRSRRPGTLAELWNGTRWSIRPTPSAGEAANGMLYGVSCTTAVACIAVGDGAGALAERWNGRHWAVQPTGAPNGALRAVSCSAPGACAAVGFSSNGGGIRTLAERWNGRRWRVQATRPLRALVNDLVGVSCRSATRCTAVGESGNDGPQGPRSTLAERWNGKQWSVQTTHDPAGAQLSQLGGVACVSETVCVAVGNTVSQSNGPAGEQMNLAERWDSGSWRIQPTPTPGGPTSSALNGVSCSSAGACTAVGWTHDRLGGQITLTERWNGNRWVIDRTPNRSLGGPPLQGNELDGVSCLSPSSCVAVGRSFDAQALRFATLIERWNGTSWTIEPSPNGAAATSSYLSGVSCTSPRDCTAVGNTNDNHASPNGGTLIEQWDGTSWSIVSSPTTHTAAAGLEAVSCTAADACTAVGQDGSNNAAALAERWDGTSWTVQALPGVGELRSVSCTSLTACSAVAQQVGAHWTGTSWSAEATLPMPGPLAGVLRGVSCSAPSACTAVGSSFPVSSTQATVAERWDGSRWARQVTSSPSKQSLFNAVSCAATNCVAVGASGDLPLVEAYSAAAPHSAPSAVTGLPTPVSQRSATLRGAVNPGGSTVSACEFQWGATAGYGRSLACRVPNGSGTAGVAVSAVVRGLVAGSTYRYRLRVVAGGRSVLAAARTFTTRSAGGVLTFGNATVGGGGAGLVADSKRVNRYSLPRAGRLSGLSVFLAPTGVRGRQSVMGVVYGDAHGRPGRLLARSEALVFHGGGRAGWYRLGLRRPLGLAAGTYWIGIITGARAKVAGYRYSLVAGSRDVNDNRFASGPTRRFGRFARDDKLMSLYAAYTPSASALRSPR